MTRPQYWRAINAAQLHGFHFLADLLLTWYHADYPPAPTGRQDFTKPPKRAAS